MNHVQDWKSFNEGKDNKIDVDSIVPDKKDFDRADGLQFQGKTFYGNGAPFHSSASKMAKLITDKEKLVRRSKAVVDRWGTENHIGFAGGNPRVENVWNPFKQALEEAGFTREEILKISRYKK